MSQVLAALTAVVVGFCFPLSLPKRSIPWALHVPSVLRPGYEPPPVLTEGNRRSAILSRAAG